MLLPRAFREKSRTLSEAEISRAVPPLSPADKNNPCHIENIYDNIAETYGTAFGHNRTE